MSNQQLNSINWTRHHREIILTNKSEKRQSQKEHWKQPEGQLFTNRTQEMFAVTALLADNRLISGIASTPSVPGGCSQKPTRAAKNLSIGLPITPGRSDGPCGFFDIPPDDYFGLRTLKELVSFVSSLDPAVRFNMLRSTHPSRMVRLAYNYTFHKRWTD